MSSAFCTGVAGPAAEMGHRLTIGVPSWQASVQLARHGMPTAAELTVDIDSLQWSKARAVSPR